MASVRPQGPDSIIRFSGEEIRFYIFPEAELSIYIFDRLSSGVCLISISGGRKAVCHVIDRRAHVSYGTSSTGVRFLLIPEIITLTIVLTSDHLVTGEKTNVNSGPYFP